MPPNAQDATGCLRTELTEREARRHRQPQAANPARSRPLKAAQRREAGQKGRFWSLPRYTCEISLHAPAEAIRKPPNDPGPPLYLIQRNKSPTNPVILLMCHHLLTGWCHMARKAVRIQVPVSPGLATAMNRIHELTGEPKSRILADMLDAMAPVFAEQVEALHKLADSPERAREYVVQMGTQGIHQISQQLLDLPPVPPKRGRPRKHAAP